LNSLAGLGGAARMRDSAAPAATVTRGLGQSLAAAWSLSAFVETLGAEFTAGGRRPQSSTGESLHGTKLESSELIKEFEINSNILNRTNNRVDSKGKILQEAAKTVAVD